jgi:outer membrane protein assembly factor BamB/TolA-binding protein
LAKLKELYPDEDNAQEGAEERLLLARALEKNNAPEQALAAYQEVLQRFPAFEDPCDEARDALKRLKGDGPKEDPLRAPQAWSVAEEHFRTALNAGQTLAADRIMRDFAGRFPFSEECGIALCNRGGLRLDYACDESALPFYERAMNEFSRNETVRNMGLRGVEFARLYRPERGQLETNRQAETSLAAIQRQLRNGNNQDNAAGLKALGDLLVAQPGALVRVGGPELYPRCASLTVVAREFLATLTPEERQLFREPMARAAETHYRQALSMNDALELEELARKYPGAEGSAKALNRAGNLYLDHGLYARAAEAFGALLRDFKGSGLIDEALAAAKEIRALQGLGQAQAARDAARKLVLDYAGSKLNIEGREMTVGAFAAEVERHLPVRADQESPQNGLEYETFAANTRRMGAALATPAPVPAALEWVHGIQQSDAAVRARSIWSDDKTYFHAEPFPVAGGGRIYFATRQEVRAIDPANGKEIWRKNWGNAASYAGYDKSTGFPVTCPVFKDGKLFVRVISSERNSVLRCYDAENGKVDWDSERNLRALMWNSEPLAAYNLVYASYFEPVDHDMVRCGIAALDARTGALVWKKTFGVGNSGVRLAERTRETRTALSHIRNTLQLGPPSAYEGVVYAATGLGSLAALNAYTGEVLWLTDYPRLRAGPLSDGNSGLTPFAPRWMKVLARGPSSPVVGDDVVVLAPRDAAGIAAFDRRTGEMRWSRELLDARFIAGVCEGKLLAADDVVTALDMNTGKIAWEFTPDSKRLAGQPGYSGGMLYLPYEDGLRIVDARNGKLSSQHEWDQKTEGPLVNFLVLGTRIIGVNYGMVGSLRAK